MTWRGLLSVSFAGALALSLPTAASAQSSEALLAKYPAPAPFKGKPAAVNLASHKDARLFRTRLREAAPTGPNFAGHMTVTTWGCGTACQTVALIDARNGTVYIGPGSSAGVKHRLDSRLLIVNAPEDVKETWGDRTPPEHFTTGYYLWENGKLRKIKP